MIDESKLIEEIKNFNMSITGIQMTKELREYIKNYKESIIRIINEQPNMTEWIPIEERPPEPGQHVFVKYYDVYYKDEEGNLYYFDEPFIDEARYYEDDRGHLWHVPNDDEPLAGGDEDLKIVAWMPYFLK